ncbi:DAO-domain-containing protein [Ascodesmis nigricans]|uniref:DAO-domain-containing protein n=1 Tax=Ascodesmis nigricans TaxID=341454 RepID=A0A4S2N3J8_9PEZI|nr:DAO-domain-containing protein [Ascodesmis nigricans]
MASHNTPEFTILHDSPTDDPGVPCPASTASFWHSEPSAFLHSHRTTPTLPAAVKTVIIGSGIAGSMTFHHLHNTLTQYQLGPTLMLEARNTCYGATGRNGGHCRPSPYQNGFFEEYCAAWGPSETLTRIRFELLNLQLVREYVRRYQVDCEFVEIPTADVYYEKPALEIARKNLAAVHKFAPEIARKCRLVTDEAEEGRRELRDVLRTPTAKGAVVFEAAKLWPYKLVEAILERAVKEQGLNLQTETLVEAIRRKRNRWEVQTSRGTVLAERVIVAANAHTGHILPQFRGWIYPVRGQMSALTPPTTLLTKPLTHTYILIRDDRRKSDYLIQRPQPSCQLMLGGGRQHEDAEGVLMNDDNISLNVAKYLRTAISGYFANEIGYLSDNVPTKSSPAPGTRKSSDLRESFIERFRNLAVSAGHDAWDAAEGAGMYSQLAASQDFHHRRLSQPSFTIPLPNECHAEYEWSGVMGFSRDEKPFVGRVPAVSSYHARRLGIPEMQDTEGLWVIAGFEGHGMALTTGSAKKLAEMVKTDVEGGRWDEGVKGVQQEWFPRGFMSTPERIGLGDEQLDDEDPEVILLDGADGEPDLDKSNDKVQEDEWVVVGTYEEEAGTAKRNKA